MLREQTLEICLNHALTPELILKPKDDEKSWRWAAQDFTDGEGKMETFVIKFRDAEASKDFLNAVHNNKVVYSFAFMIQRDIYFCDQISPPAEACETTKQEEKSKQADDGNGKVPESNDPHFESVITLPALVEVKASEEDKDNTVMFSHYAELFKFNFDARKWQATGMGDFKIIYKKNKSIYRIMLRRYLLLKFLLETILNLFEIYQ